MYFKILFFVLTFILSGCVTKPVGEPYNGEEIEVDSAYSLLVIYLQDDGKGVFGKEHRFSWVVTDGADKLAIISNGSYFTYQVKPGVVELNAALLKGGFYLPTNAVDLFFDGINAIQNSVNNKNLKYKTVHKMEVDKGEVYYLKWTVSFPKKIAWGGPDPIVTLTEVPEETGIAELEGLSKALLPEE